MPSHGRVADRSLVDILAELQEDPEDFRRRYAEAEKRWEEAFAPLEKQVRESQILSAEDYLVTINARAEDA